MTQIATAWAAVACWAVRQGAVAVDQMDAPWVGETDEWMVSINGANVERDGIPPKGIILNHKTYLCFACLGPFDGALGGGITEAEIIEHFGAPTEASEGEE